ncbi:17137_t:CDS:1, partial [Acaulospora morrowiae]
STNSPFINKAVRFNPMVLTGEAGLELGKLVENERIVVLARTTVKELIDLA